MDSTEKVSYATGLHHDAEALMSEGKTDEALELIEKASGLMDEYEAETKASKGLESLTARIEVPVNKLPVAVEDVKAFAQNEIRADGSYGNQKVSSSFKPAGYNEKLPAAAQSAWVKSAFGDELKQEAAAYEKAFETWVRCRNDDQFNKTAPEWMIKALSEGTDSAGGYTVPTYTEPSVIVNSGAFGDQIRPRVRQFNVSTDAGTIPTSGGVSVSAIAEAGAITGAESDPTFTGVSFAINKYGALTRVSDELLADSATNIPALLQDLFGTAFGQFQDKTIINQILASAASDYTMASATAVAAADLMGIFYQLPAQHRGGGAHWIMTSQIGADMGSIGSTAAGQHVATDLTVSPATTLLGKPVIYDDNSSNLATTIATGNEIAIFGDLNQFGFVNREGRTLKRLNELYAGNGQVGFLATERNDAEVLLPTAFEVLKAA